MRRGAWWGTSLRETLDMLQCELVVSPIDETVDTSDELITED